MVTSDFSNMSWIEILLFAPNPLLLTPGLPVSKQLLLSVADLWFSWGEGGGFQFLKNF